MLHQPCILANVFAPLKSRLTHGSLNSQANPLSLLPACGALLTSPQVSSWQVAGSASGTRNLDHFQRGEEHRSIHVFLFQSTKMMVRFIVSWMVNLSTWMKLKLQLKL